jgi:hypothetical protein
MVAILPNMMTISLREPHITLISPERYDYIYDKIVVVIGQARIDPPAADMPRFYLADCIHNHHKAMADRAVRSKNWKAPHLNTVISGHFCFLSIGTVDKLW